eukprot:TRINITY_DN67377_c10_g1_i1.p1 TRINITY_DN67377_c10_g1~~TRINITY_DN67377_c10_g1_i1.p1  ORF type:complete len:124 (+),score=0.89 TRINITY_DN67377_c10_g1_i1:534-905(+)
MSCVTTVFINIIFLRPQNKLVTIPVPVASLWLPFTFKFSSKEKWTATGANACSLAIRREALLDLKDTQCIHWFRTSFMSESAPSPLHNHNDFTLKHDGVPQLQCWSCLCLPIGVGCNDGGGNT